MPYKSEGSMPIYRIPIQRTMNETVYVETGALDRALARVNAGETVAELGEGRHTW